MPPSVLRGRVRVVEHVYDADGRLARTITAGDWLDIDRLLMLARARHRESLCPGCGHPKGTAWHSDNEGWFENVADYVCNGCSARAAASRADSGDEVTYHAIADTRDYAARPLPPFPHPAPRGPRPVGDPPDEPPAERGLAG